MFDHEVDTWFIGVGSSFPYFTVILRISVFFQWMNTSHLLKSGFENCGVQQSCVCFKVSVFLTKMINFEKEIFTNCMDVNKHIL